MAMSGIPGGGAVMSRKGEYLSNMIAAGDVFIEQQKAKECVPPLSLELV